MPSQSIIARNGIIRDIKLKIAFKPGFIESEDDNIVLFKKEISTPLFLQQQRILMCDNLSLEELKEEFNEAIFKQWRCSKIVPQFELLDNPVDQWC